MLYVRCYLLLLELKKWHRYAMTALLFTVLSLLWLFACYLPISKQVMMIGVYLEQSKKDLQKNASERELCKSLSQEIEQLEHETKDISSIALNNIEESMGLIISQIEHLAMRLLSIKKIGTVSKGQHRIILVSTQIQGSLGSIMQFFSLLKNNQLLVQCSHFVLQYEREETYMLHAVLKIFGLQKSKQNESPSTLEKS
jgi:hypothetical protein